MSAGTRQFEILAGARKSGKTSKLIEWCLEGEPLLVERPPIPVPHPTRENVLAYLALDQAQRDREQRKEAGNPDLYCPFPHWTRIVVVPGLPRLEAIIRQAVSTFESLDQAHKADLNNRFFQFAHWRDNITFHPDVDVKIDGLDDVLRMLFPFHHGALLGGSVNAPADSFDVEVLGSRTSDASTR